MITGYEKQLREIDRMVQRTSQHDRMFFYCKSVIVCDRVSTFLSIGDCQTPVMETKLLATITLKPMARMKVVHVRLFLRGVNLLHVAILTYTGKHIIDNVSTVSWSFSGS